MPFTSQALSLGLDKLQKAITKKLSNHIVATQTVNQEKLQSKLATVNNSQVQNIDLPTVTGLKTSNLGNQTKIQKLKHLIRSNTAVQVTIRLRSNISRNRQKLLVHVCGCTLVYAVFLELRQRAQDQKLMKESIIALNHDIDIQGINNKSQSQSTVLKTGDINAMPPIVFVPGYKGTALKSPTKPMWGDIMSVFRMLSPQKNDCLKTSCEWKTYSESSELESSESQYQYDILQPDDYEPYQNLQSFKLFNFFTLHPGQEYISKFFQQLDGPTQSRPYFEFLYDWRRSPIEIGLQLDSFLVQLQHDKELNPSGLKPQVVGHSFGALILLYLITAKEIEYPKTDNQIQQTITQNHISQLSQVYNNCYSVACYNTPRNKKETGSNDKPFLIKLQPEKYGSGSMIQGPGSEISENYQSPEKYGSESQSNSKFHSVLLMAPPVRMTPFFCLDMILGDPDYLLHGRTHFTFASVFTFFPDNVYNKEGRWLEVIDLNKNGEKNCETKLSNIDSNLDTTTSNLDHRFNYYKTVSMINRFFYTGSSWWPISDDKDAYKGVQNYGYWDMYRRFFHEKKGQKVVEWITKQRERIDECLEQTKQFTSDSLICSSLASFASSINPLKIWNRSKTAQGYHISLPIEYINQNSIKSNDIDTESDSNTNLHIMLDFTDPNFWMSQLNHPGQKDNSQLYNHVKHACNHSAIFWKRIAEGSGSLTSTYDYPIALVIGNGFKTGEKLVLLEESESDTDSESDDTTQLQQSQHQQFRHFYLDGSYENTKVLGDGRLPGNRIMPRGEGLERWIKVYYTQLGHCAMLKDLRVIREAMGYLNYNSDLILGS